MFLTKYAVRADKTPVKLKLIGAEGSLTRLGLEVTIELYKSRFGGDPPVLEGTLAEFNLANFQKEFAERFWKQGINGHDAALGAVQAISAMINSTSRRRSRR